MVTQISWRPTQTVRIMVNTSRFKLLQRSSERRLHSVLAGDGSASMSRETSVGDLEVRNESTYKQKRDG